MRVHMYVRMYGRMCICLGTCVRAYVMCTCYDILEAHSYVRMYVEYREGLVNF